MGTYYNFAVVHDRVLIWWTDNAGDHERWIEGDAAKAFTHFVSMQDCKVQGRIRALLEDGR